MFQQIRGRASRAVKRKSVFNQLSANREQFRFRLRRSGRKQNLFLGRDAVSGCQHGLQNRFVEIFAQTADFAGGRHFDAQNRVGFRQTGEAELRRFNSNVVEVERASIGLFNGNAQDDFRRKFDQVDFQHLGNERERAAGAEVAFDHFDVVVTRQKLHVERSGNIQSLGDFSSDLFDSANRFDVQFLRREDDRRVAGMDAGKLDVFGNGVGDNLPVLSDSVEFNLFGVDNKFRNDDRVLLRHVRRQGEEMIQFRLVGNDVHCRAGKDVAGANHQREPDLVGEIVNLVHRRQFAPAGLVYAHLVT